MGPVPQPAQSPARARGRGGGVVGDLPVEGRGAARAVGLERRGEGAPGRGAVGRAALPGAAGGRVQCGPGRVGAAQAPEERRQVPRRALQGQQQEVPRARQEGHRPPQPQQHRESRLPRPPLTDPSTLPSILPLILYTPRALAAPPENSFPPNHPRIMNHDVHSDGFSSRCANVPDDPLRVEFRYPLINRAWRIIFSGREIFVPM